MNFEAFLTNKEPDFKGRFLHDILCFSDEDIENTHDFIQLLFPLDVQSNNAFHGHYLDTEKSVRDIRSNDLAQKNIIKSSKWFLDFLERDDSWLRWHDHNYLRITRIIKSLGLLVSVDEANIFYNLVLELIDDDRKEKINPVTLKFWKEALKV